MRALRNLPAASAATLGLATAALLASAGGTRAQGMEQPTVSTAVVRAEMWQPSIKAVGSLRAVRGADLAAEVSGVVDWIGFQSGEDVQAGALLVRLRANDDPAKLAELQAAADLASTNLARDTKQFRAQAVSQATIDADESRLKSARAQVEQHQALMAEKQVRAPFAGHLGLRQVDLGQYLPAGTPVVTLQALDPIFADFYVPQQVLGAIRPGQAVRLQVDAFPGKVFAAHVTAISPKLDQASRMAQIRAELPNHDHGLLPGMFATVSVDSGAVQHYATVPNAAIVYNPYGSIVYVLNHANPPTVHQVLVKTGETRGDQVAVLEGIHEGDIIVTSGQIKLHDGMAVTVNNSVQPTSEASPNPPEE